MTTKNWNHEMQRKQSQANLKRQRANYHAQMRNYHAERAQLANPLVRWVHRMKAGRHNGHHAYLARRAAQHNLRLRYIQMQQQRNKLRQARAEHREQYGRPSAWKHVMNGPSRQITAGIHMF
jgi:hypothetical protein